jgi:hypothetical protein
LFKFVFVVLACLRVVSLFAGYFEQRDPKTSQR